MDGNAGRVVIGLVTMVIWSGLSWVISGWWPAAPDRQFVLAATLVGAGVAVATVAWLFNRQLRRWGWSRSKRSMLAAALLVLLLLLSLAGLALALAGVLAVDPGASPVLLIALVAAELATAILVYLCVSTRQYGSSFTVTVSEKDRIDVRRLSLISPDSEIRMHLDWGTFTSGLDYLNGQLKGQSGGYSVDLFVGLNDSGLAMAAYLRGLCGNGKQIVSQMRNDNPEHRAQWVGDPPPKEDLAPPSGVDAKIRVLIVDLEWKSGDALRHAREKIANAYGADSILVQDAVLVACGVDNKKKIEDMKDLDTSKYVRKGEQVIIPRFVAFVSWNKIEPPHEIR